MSSDEILVKMADLAVSGSTLKTIGLGSCVGLIIQAKFQKVAGLAHIMLPEQAKLLDKHLIAKYATSAIPLLIDRLLDYKIPLLHLEAKLVGGANMFKFSDPQALGVGQKNIEICRKMLASYGIPIVAEDVGGSVSRTLIHYPANGKTLVKTVFKGEAWL